MKACLHMLAYTVALGILLGGQCPSDPIPPGGGAETSTLLQTLKLAGQPTNIVLGRNGSLAYVGDGKVIRRIDPAARSFSPLSYPNGVFYCVDPYDDLIGEINPATGRITRMFASPRFIVNGILIAGTPFGITHNPTSQRLFVIDPGSGGRRPALFEIDPQTGEYRQIGEPGLGNPMTSGSPPVGMDGASCLARDPSNGLLYTVDFGPVDHLWRIDPTTGVAAAAGNEFIGYNNIQGLSFSPEGVLHGIHNGGNVFSTLVRIDLATGLASEVATVPVYGPYSLAFKMDGTLWLVEVLGDTLIQIDPNTGALVQQFPTLKMLRPSAVGYYFDTVCGLTYAPQGGAYPTVPAVRSLDSVGVDGNGGVLAATGDDIFAFDSAMAQREGGLDIGGLKTFRSVVTHPDTGAIYVRDGLAGTVYEINPTDLSLVREIKYAEVPVGTFFATPQQPEMQLDPTTGLLYLVHNSAIFAVNLSAGTSEQLTFGGDAQGLIVDSARRRLHVNTLLGGVTADGENCSTIRTLDLDTLGAVGEVCVGVQVFGMAFDAQRNRIAANARFDVATFDTRVFLFNMETLSSIAYDLVIPGSEGTDIAFYAVMAIDADRNQLLVGVGGDYPRIEFHQLP